MKSDEESGREIEMRSFESRTSRKHTSNKGGCGEGALEMLLRA